MLTRRETIRRSAIVAGMLASSGLFPQFAHAYNSAAFAGKSVPDMARVFGASAPVESKDVTITGPDIAENGNVVPLGASSTLAGIKHLLILVEKNPISVLVAIFNVSDATEASFLTRAKMAQSSDVYAVAITNDGKALFSKKEVKVTLGGCGG